MARIQRIARLGLLLLIVGTSGCIGGKHDGELKMRAEEVRLVEETVLMIRIRLETTRDPAAATEMRARTSNLYTDEEREFLLDRLAADSARGELVMSALHDSLESMRAELFPPSQP